MAAAGEVLLDGFGVFVELFDAGSTDDDAADSGFTKTPGQSKLGEREAKPVRDRLQSVDSLEHFGIEVARHPQIAFGISGAAFAGNVAAAVLFPSAHLGPMD